MSPDKMPRDWASIPMGQDAQAFFQKVFLPRIQALKKEVEGTPLVVLVWGPGPSGDDLYDKRLQIRGTLREIGIAAVFSEEIAIPNVDEGWSEKGRELLEAIAADFIVVIHGSPGSIAESHDFSGYVKQIGQKMLIFVDDRFTEGYSFKGALQDLQTLYHNVETFSYPTDIRECYLLGKVQKKVLVLRQAKWRQALS